MRKKLFDPQYEAEMEARLVAGEQLETLTRNAIKLGILQHIYQGSWGLEAPLEVLEDLLRLTSQFSIHQDKTMPSLLDSLRATKAPQAHGASSNEAFPLNTLLVSYGNALRAKQGEIEAQLAELGIGIEAEAAGPRLAQPGGAEIRQHFERLQIRQEHRQESLEKNTLSSENGHDRKSILRQLFEELSALAQRIGEEQEGVFSRIAQLQALPADQNDEDDKAWLIDALIRMQMKADFFIFFVTRLETYIISEKIESFCLEAYIDPGKMGPSCGKRIEKLRADFTRIYAKTNGAIQWVHAGSIQRYFETTLDYFEEKACLYQQITREELEGLELIPAQQELNNYIVELECLKEILIKLGYASENNFKPIRALVEGFRLMADLLQFSKRYLNVRVDIIPGKMTELWQLICQLAEDEDHLKNLEWRSKNLEVEAPFCQDIFTELFANAKTLNAQSSELTNKMGWILSKASLPELEEQLPFFEKNKNRSWVGPFLHTLRIRAGALEAKITDNLNDLDSLYTLVGSLLSGKDVKADCQKVLRYLQQEIQEIEKLFFLAEKVCAQSEVNPLSSSLRFKSLLEGHIKAYQALAQLPLIPKNRLSGEQVDLIQKNGRVLSYVNGILVQQRPEVRLLFNDKNPQFNLALANKCLSEIRKALTFLKKQFVTFEVIQASSGFGMLTEAQRIFLGTEYFSRQKNECDKSYDELKTYEGQLDKYLEFAEQGAPDNPKENNDCASPNKTQKFGF